MEPNSEMSLSPCPIFVLSAEFPAPAGMSGIRQVIDPPFSKVMQRINFADINPIF